MSAPITVVVADDQAVVREGLVTLLQAAPDIEPVGAAQDGAEAVQLCSQYKPHVALMDLRMPIVNGVEATRRIRAACPDTEVVVLTTHTDDASIFDALEAGAISYLTKDAGIAKIAEAIRVAAGHQGLLDPEVQRRLVIAARATAATNALPVELPDGLTPREAQVLTLIAEGHPNREIAELLHVSEATVKTHVNHVFSKIEARDRAQAVRYAHRTGLVR